MQRQSDVYVFCLYKHKDQSTVNPLDVEQWEFYVASSQLLNEKCGNQKTIRLSTLRALGVEPVQYENIRNEILTVTEGEKSNTV